METREALLGALIDHGFGEFPDGLEGLVKHIDKRGDKAAFLRDLAKAFFAASFMVEGRPVETILAYHPGVNGMVQTPPQANVPPWLTCWKASTSQGTQAHRCAGSPTCFGRFRMTPKR
jgi:hypothetical protein